MNSDLKPSPGAIRYSQPRPFTAKMLPTLKFPRPKKQETNVRG